MVFSISYRRVATSFFVTIGVFVSAITIPINASAESITPDNGPYIGGNTVKVEVPDLVKYTTNSSLDQVMVAQDGNDDVWAWGNNDKGQLGIGNTIDSNVPVKVIPSWGDRKIVKVKLVNSTILALASDSTVWAWGVGVEGELGNGFSRDSNVPVQVIKSWGDRKIVDIYSNYYSSYALASDNTLWAWGYRLGNGTDLKSNVPVQVTPSWGERKIVSVKTGGISLYVISDDNSVWALGDNFYGQLGRGNNNASNVPVQVTPSWGERKIADIRVVETSVYALASDNTLWAWGNNQFGQLGIGNVTSSSLPVQVTPNWGDKKVIEFDSSGISSYAVTSDGSLWAWGNNQFGQVGNDSATGTNVPVKVIPNWGERKIVKVESGTSGAYALASDNTLWAWGNNQFGQLGNGNNTSSRSPVQVISVWGDKKIIEVESIRNYSYVRAHGDDIWSWGRNDDGQLGVGTWTSSNVPLRSLWKLSSIAFGANEITDFTENPDGSYNIVVPRVVGVGKIEVEFRTKAMNNINAGPVYVLKQGYIYRHFDVRGKVYKDLNFNSLINLDTDKPFTGTQVNIYDMNDVFIQTSNISSDGSYSFTNIPNGSYKLSINNTSWKTVSGNLITVKDNNVISDLLLQEKVSDPLLNNDVANVYAGESVTIDVAANDALYKPTDTGSVYEINTIDIDTKPLNGGSVIKDVNINGYSSLKYVASNRWPHEYNDKTSYIDSFTYSYKNAVGVTKKANVQVTVYRAFSIVDEDITIKTGVVHVDVLANDSGHDLVFTNTPSLVDAVTGVSVSYNNIHRVLVVDSSNYQWAQDEWYKSLQIIYSAEDFLGSTGDGITNIRIQRPPSSVDKHLTINTDKQKSIDFDVISNVFHGDKSKISFSALSNPGNGKVVITGNGENSNVTYYAKDDFVGNDIVELRISDDLGQSVTVSYSITVVDKDTVTDLKTNIAMRARNFTIPKNQVHTLTPDLVANLAGVYAWNIETGEELSSKVDYSRITATPGVYNVDVVSSTLNKKVKATVTDITLLINLSANDIYQGDTVTITGAGFAAGEKVTGTIFSDPYNIGNQTADSSGRVIFAANIPLNFPLGAHTATLTGEFSGSISASLKVLHKTTGNNSGKNTKNIANTGALNVTEGFYIAFVFMLFGGTILLIRFRKVGCATSTQ